MAFRTSRTFTVRGRPPRLAGGISEPTSAHSASVKSLSYRTPRRSAAARCSGFHMRHLSPTQVPHKESQPIPPTQLLSGTAIRLHEDEGFLVEWVHQRGPWPVVSWCHCHLSRDANSCSDPR